MNATLREFRARTASESTRSVPATCSPESSQMVRNLILANGIGVHLSGGIQAKNIFWQVSGQAKFGTTSHMEGIVLCKSLIALQTGASINGRVFAQTAVTLQKNTVTQPN